MEEPHFKARVRGIGVDQSELLAVRLSHDPSYACLPGGGLDYGEALVPALERELVEELGVKPVVGDLLFSYSWMDEKTKTHNLEYFFEIKNASDYRNVDNGSASHKDEIAEIVWLKPNDGVVIRPLFLRNEIDKGTLLQSRARVVGP